MKLKKSIAGLLAVLFAVAALAMAASADTTVSVAGAEYKVVSPQAVAITGEGVTPSLRGNGTIEVLIDGDIARTVTNHDQKGIVLIVNDEVSKRASSPVKQDLDNIPTASIEMDFGSNVSFDTAYMAIYWQQVCIGEPADNKVIIETSADGKVWVPVGADGTFYFSLRKCPDYEDGLPNGGNGYPHIGEVAIPLGETISARYVRYSYSFPPIPKDFAWEWYTNVYEFIGFTEVGVATFNSGRKPAKLSAKDVETYPAIEGSWVTEDGEEVTVATFKDDKGELEYIANIYDKAVYLESGSEAEATDTVEGHYFVEGDTVALITDDGYDDYTVSFDEDGNLILELDGEEHIYYTVENYASANGVKEPNSETSGDESADTETSDESSDASAAEESSSAASETSGKADTSSKTGTSSAASSKADASGKTDTSSGEDGAPVGLIVGIVVAVVVIIAAVVVIIVVRKKKQ